MKIYDLYEITDSRVLYDKNPPRFIMYIILIVLSLIIGFFIWSDRTIKTYVVRTQGVVTTENKTNIMNNITGEISSVNVEEGKEVKAGDVLFTINPTDPNLQIQQANEQLKYDNKRIDLLTRAEQDASNGKNSFNKYSSEEVEFYNRLQDNYVKAGEYTVNEQSLKEQGYTDEQIKQQKQAQSIKLNELHYDTIVTFTAEKTQLESDKSKLEAQIAVFNKSLNLYNVTAQKSGKVHLAISLSKGMVLQQGNSIGSISDTTNGLIIEALLQSNERPMVNVGDEVSLAVSGLNQEEYGTIRGKIISIDQDANIDSQKGTVYFNLKIKPEQTFLQDKKGTKVNLTLGMEAEARVKYDKITYMKYFLEQIGIKLT